MGMVNKLDQETVRGIFDTLNHMRERARQIEGHAVTLQMVLSIDKPSDEYVQQHLPSEKEKLGKTVTSNVNVLLDSVEAHASVMISEIRKAMDQVKHFAY